MSTNAWVQEFPCAITVCDTAGIIVAMNDKAVQTFLDDGGRALIGTNLMDCHPEPARAKLRQLMDSKQTNVYTIEKEGKRKLIYQAPWFENGLHRGLVELSIEIPEQIPHFIRDK